MGVYLSYNVCLVSPRAPSKISRWPTGVSAGLAWAENIMIIGRKFCLVVRNLFVSPYVDKFGPSLPKRSPDMPDHFVSTDDRSLLTILPSFWKVCMEFATSPIAPTHLSFLCNLFQSRIKVNLRHIKPFICRSS